MQLRTAVFHIKANILRIQPFEIIISFRNHIFVSLYPLDWIFFKKNIILFLYIKMQRIVDGRFAAETFLSAESL